MTEKRFSGILNKSEWDHPLVNTPQDFLRFSLEAQREGIPVEAYIRQLAERARPFLEGLPSGQLWPVRRDIPGIKPQKWSPETQEVWEEHLRHEGEL